MRVINCLINIWQILRIHINPKIPRLAAHIIISLIQFFFTMVQIFHAFVIIGITLLGSEIERYIIWFLILLFNCNILLAVSLLNRGQWRLILAQKRDLFRTSASWNYGAPHAPALMLSHINLEWLSFRKLIISSNNFILFPRLPLFLGRNAVDTTIVIELDVIPELIIRSILHRVTFQPHLIQLIFTIL